MFEYIKGIFDKGEPSAIAKDLTPEQKKKYKKQFLGTILLSGVLAAVLIGGIVDAINILFEGRFLAIALVLLFTRELSRTIEFTKEEIELIQERIEKRTRKM